MNASNALDPAQDFSQERKSLKTLPCKDQSLILRRLMQQNDFLLRRLAALESNLPINNVNAVEDEIDLEEIETHSAINPRIPEEEEKAENSGVNRRKRPIFSTESRNAVVKMEEVRHWIDNLPEGPQYKRKKQ